MKNVILIAAFSLISMSANAITVTHNIAPGSETYNSNAIVSAAHFSDMVNMRATATYSDGSTAVASLNSSGSALSSNFFRLDSAGPGANTFFSGWTLVNQNSMNMVSFEMSGLIDGGVGVFDYHHKTVTGADDERTPGSGNGGPGIPAGPGGITIDGNIASAEFNYFNRVMLNGVFYGDLYETLRIDLESMVQSALLRYTADTDLALVPGANAVPVPAAVWLFGSALGLLGWVRRRNPTPSSV
jgi:hypothetical protein